MLSEDAKVKRVKCCNVLQYSLTNNAVRRIQFLFDKKIRMGKVHERLIMKSNDAIDLAEFLAKLFYVAEPK